MISDSYIKNLNKEVILLIKNENFKAAQDMLRVAYFYNYDNTTILNLMGIIYLKQYKFSQAERILSLSFNIDKNDFSRSVLKYLFINRNIIKGFNEAISEANHNQYEKLEKIIESNSIFNEDVMLEKILVDIYLKEKRYIMISKLLIKIPLKNNISICEYLKKQTNILIIICLFISERLIKMFTKNKNLQY